LPFLIKTFVIIIFNYLINYRKIYILVTIIKLLLGGRPMIMKGKILFFVLLVLLSTAILPFPVIAGDDQNPEIVDTVEDARSYLDIEKAWFFEEESTPNYLYTTIKLRNSNVMMPKQHLTVHWKMDDEIYWTICSVGYEAGQWIHFNFGIGIDYWYDRAEVFDIEGEFDKESGTVTCKIPKSLLNDPEPGTILTDTSSECFERFGFFGRLGFGPKMRSILFYKLGLPELQVQDFAPNIIPGEEREYGKDYIIQY